MLSQAKTLSARNAWINPQRKFFPVKWKTPPTNMARRTAVSLPIFSRHILKQKFYAKWSLNLQFGDATYMISFEFSLWDISTQEIQAFIEQANLRHSTIKFTVEISDTETVFLDTAVYKGTRFNEKSIPVVKTHLKKTETFQFTHFISCNPLSVKKRFVKGEALRILTPKKLHSRKLFQISQTLDWQRLPTNFDGKPSIRYKVHREGVCTLATQQQRRKRSIAFSDTVPALSVYLKEVLMKKWNLIQDQPLIRQIFKEPPIISYKKENP